MKKNFFSVENIQVIKQYHKLRRLETIESQIDEETDDFQLLPVTPQPIATDELKSIQQQLSKWLSNYKDEVTEDQFITLLKKIAPFVRETDIKELFHQFDFQNVGHVNKQVLLQNNYLANLIIVRDRIYPISSV